MRLPDFRYERGDALEFMDGLASQSVKLILTSPPYNMGKAYEARTSMEAYLEEMRPALSEMRRILAEDGSICWQTGNYVEKGPASVSESLPTRRAGQSFPRSG